MESLISCSSDFSFLRNVSNKRDSVSSGYPNTEKRVENTTCSRVFLMKFEVFGNPMKHGLECLIYLLNGYDFLCFNLMNF